MAALDGRVDGLPYMTVDLPGIGGQIKARPEDFQVEEIPLYAPGGAGTHVYFGIEKTSMPTERAIEAIAKELGVLRRDIGFAGLKDTHAVTRQTLSVEHVDPQRVRALDIRGIHILWVDRHTNKLKLGHLAGNRFSIKVREMQPGTEAPARAIVEVLARRGMPNYFGPQRFGVRGDNGLVGLAALRGDYDEAVAVMLGRPGPLDHGDALTARQHYDQGNYAAAARAWPWALGDHRRACQTMARSGGATRKAWKTLPWHVRRLYLSALQGELFNRVVARRIDRLDQVLLGDLAMKHPNQAVFRVTDPEAEQPRCEAFEISPTGPLFGRRMTEPEGEPAALEEAVLAEAGLSRAALVEQPGERLDGTRRSLRVRPGDPTVESGSDEMGPFVRLDFSLPSGAYATTLLREVCKNP